MSKNYKRTERFATTQTNSEPRPIKKLPNKTKREHLMNFLATSVLIVTSPYLIILLLLIVIFGEHLILINLIDSYMKLIDKFE